MDLSFRELQRRLKDLNLGPVSGAGITKNVLLQRYLDNKQREEVEEKETSCLLSLDKEN